MSPSGFPLHLHIGRRSNATPDGDNMYRSYGTPDRDTMYKSNGTPDGDTMRTASSEFGIIAYASSEGSGEPAHPRSLARTFAARSYKQWIKRNLQTESQIPGPSEWLGMQSWNLSWQNARRHKFAWRGSCISLMELRMEIPCKSLTDSAQNLQ